MSNERCTIKGFNIGHPFGHSLFAPDLTPIYKLCHSRKSINRPLIPHEKGRRKPREKKEEKEESSSRLAPPRTTKGRRSAAAPPP
ncbi:hypothetical protein MA16_Dca000687 [Dendrobium catenatum]|uniref:Uncharacterized protein n=1 Tax=Dendrobium catenatum TaxID=906689 RepID=A0A2I0WUJ9_9ASPA|nr:hypothetical protein MA16_Dca000687 [Dendrobium catenatum]